MLFWYILLWMCRLYDHSRLVPSLLEVWGKRIKRNVASKTKSRDTVNGIMSSWIIFHIYSWNHWLITYKDTKAKCRHEKNLPVKGLCVRCLSDFIDWIYSQSWEGESQFGWQERNLSTLSSLCCIQCERGEGMVFWASDR